MKVLLEDQEYDTLLLPIEWRFSAALTGLQRFFEFVEETEGKKLYSETDRKQDGNLAVYSEIGGYIEGMKYNRAELTEKRYLKFCEHYFRDDMQHVCAEKILQSTSEYSEAQIDRVNSLLTGQEANTVLKKTFGKCKFDGTNQATFLEMIEENRLEIIRETFRYKPNLYKNYANENKLFSEQNSHCRLQGYDLDATKKSKSTAYRFDKVSFLAQDCFEFDFIPFAFTNSSQEAFFINSNFSILDLMKCNDTIKDEMEKKEVVQDNKVVRDRGKTKLIKIMLQTYDYFNFDVEVIVKKRDADGFETFFIRKNALRALKDIYAKHNIHFVHQYSGDRHLNKEEVNENSRDKKSRYLNVEEEVIHCCVNNLYLGSLLERLLVISREKEYANIIIDQLLKINIDWKGDADMREIITRAKEDGEHAGKLIIAKSSVNKAKININKVKSYKNKLINAIIAHNYDRVLEIMLQMSGYIDNEIGVIYDMLEHKEECSDIAISFTNALLPFNSGKE